MIRTFASTIRGVTPFLFNRYLELAEIVDRIGARPKDLSKEDAWRKEEGKLRVYENGQGLFLPGRNIRSSMVMGSDAAGIKHKHGKNLRGLGPFLRRGLVVSPLELLFGDPEIGLHRDMVRVPPRTGAMVVKYWPKLEEWELSFRLDVFDDSLQGDDELRESLAAAGLFCGLGTGRPDYGKFTVEKFEETTEK